MSESRFRVGLMLVEAILQPHGHPEYAHITPNILENMLECLGDVARGDGDLRTREETRRSDGSSRAVCAVEVGRSAAATRAALRRRASCSSLSFLGCFCC